jgi:hypothetical protein
MILTRKDRWDDLTTGTQYCEIKIGKYEACCVARDEFFMYTMEFEGKDVYSDIGGADFPLRKLTLEEHKNIMDFVREQFETEEKLEKNEIW